MGVARRRASLSLLHGGLDNSSCEDIREYLSGVLLAIRSTLRGLGFPDPPINLVIDLYGEVDKNSYLLEEIQQVQEERDRRGRDLEEVD